MTMTPRSGRIRHHQPVADRRGARDGREADPLRLFDRPARGARRLRRAARRAGQHHRPGRADPDAARHASATSSSPAPRCSRTRRWWRATSSSSTTPIRAASTCRTSSSSTRSSSTGAVIGFSASVAHHLDIGGGEPGAEHRGAGRLCGGAHHPADEAQHGSGTGTAAASSGCCAPMSACRTRRWAISTPRSPPTRSARCGCSELAERYGAEKVPAVMAALLDYSEARMRAAIREVPDGIYHGEDAVDDDGLRQRPAAGAGDGDDQRRFHRGRFRRHRAAGAAAT